MACKKKPDKKANSKGNLPKGIGSELELFKILLNKSNDAVFVNDPETGLFIDMNDKACDSLRYDRAELMKMGVMDIESTLPNDFLWRDHVAEVRRKGYLLLEGRLKRKDGTTFPVETSVSVAAVGGIDYMIAVVRDISERKQSEAALQAREKQLAESQRIAHIGSWEHNVTTNQVFWSDELFRLLGLDPDKDEADFKMFFEMVHPDDQACLKKAIEETARLGKPFSIEYRFICRGGAARIIHARAELIHDKSGASILTGTAQDITERKRAEEKLRKSEANLKRAERIGSLGNWEWIIQTNEFIWSDEVYRLYGLDPLKGKPSYDVVVQTLGPECRERFMSAVENAVKNGAPFEGEYRMISLDGTVRYTHTTGEVSRDQDGQPVSMFGIVQDITERKKMQDALQASQGLFHTVVESSADFIFVKDLEGTYVLMNRAGSLLFGKRLEDILGRDDTSLFTAEDAARIMAQDRQLIDSATSIIYEHNLTIAGELRTMQVRKGPVLDQHNRVIGVYGISRDITEHKQAEAARNEAHAKLQALVQALPDGVFFKDADGRYLMVNRAFEERTGAQQGTILGKIDVDFLPADIADGCRKSDEEVIKSGRLLYIENTLVGKDGEKTYIESVKVPVKDAKGKLLGLVGVSRNVTERKLAEEKIRQSEQFIRNILDTVDEGFIVVDPEYRILTANKAYCSQLSRNCNEVVGRHCYEVSHRKNRPCHEEGEECAVQKVLANGEPHAVCHKHLDHDGQVLYMETKAFSIKDADGKVTSVIETVNNITEKHLLEEERLRTQKLESIGALAGGIAHDFNNLLQGVFGYLSVAKMSLDGREKTLAALEQAEIALQQSVNLATQLLTFSKGGKPVKKPIDLRPAIENAAKFTLSGSRSNLRVDLADDLWQAEADEGQIVQVIQNIVLNAEQAMPMGGSVRVGGRNVSDGDPSLPPGLARGNYILISVQDTGAGIPEQYIAKIFDPYFTTKERGSGLGLATSYSIVKNHGGCIDVRTRPGEGSTFSICLPALVGKGRTELATKPGKTPSEIVARVLVMDDDDIIRNVSKELVSALGHEVEVAEHGQQALEKYRLAMEAGRPFDIAILDLTVRGGMGGMETVKKLLDIDPEVKAIVSSGYSDDTAVANYPSHGFKAYLKKPYSIDQLREVLGSVLP